MREIFIDEATKVIGAYPQIDAFIEANTQEGNNEIYEDWDNKLELAHYWNSCSRVVKENQIKL